MDQRRVARALKAGGPEVIAVDVEALPALRDDEVLVEVEAIGLNHVESLVRSGRYAIAFPFPYATGIEGAGRIVAAGNAVHAPLQTRVCWTAVFGCCATHVVARASLLALVPDEMTSEEAATIPHAAITAEGLARHWPLEPGTAALVWGAAGAVGRLLVSRLSNAGVRVIGVATGDRTETVRAAGAVCVIDRARDDVRTAVRQATDGRGVAAVFDPVGAAVYDTNLSLLAPRGCLINYGQLSGALAPVDLASLMDAGSIFVTKYGPRAGVLGADELAPTITSAVTRVAAQRLAPAVAARFPLDAAADAYRAMDAGANGKVLVIPGAK